MLVASCSSKAFMLSSSRLSALQGGLDLLAGEWRLGDPHTDGVVDGVSDNRRGQRHGRLADAVRAEHAVLLRLLDEYHLGQRRILDAQRLVVQQVAIERQTGGLVEQHLL